MDKLTEDAVREIEQIHSSWIEFEVAGEDHSLMALCADDIELWPPDAQPVLGRAAVSAQLGRGTTRIHGIEITDRRIRGSNEIAYLTSSYKTTFSSAEDSTPRQALGSHLWILEKRAGGWVVTLVSWSVWECAASAVTRQPTPSASAWADTLKAGKLEVIGLVQLPVCRQTGIGEDASALTHSGSHKLATESTHCRRMPPPESSR